MAERRWRLFGRRALVDDVKRADYADPFTGWNYTDTTVTVDRAFGLSAFYSVVRLLACAMMVPAEVIRSRDGVEVPQRVNPGSRLLEEGPNEDVTTDHWLAMIVGQLCGWGGHFSAKEFDENTGLLRQLWPIDPSRVYVYRDLRTGRKSFAVDGRQGFTSDHIFHIPYIDYSTGLAGHSPVSMMRHRLGVAIAASDTQQRQFGQGTLSPYAMVHPGTISQAAGDRLKKQLRKFRGSKNAHNWLIFEEGMEPKQLSINPKDAQFVEQLQMSDVECARMFNVPARRIDAQVQYSLTYQTGVMDDTSVVKWAQRPFARMIESSLQKDPHIIPRGFKFGVRLNLDALLRADILTRSQVAQNFDAARVRTPNDSRKHENLPAVPGEGDTLRVAVGSAPGGADG